MGEVIHIESWLRSRKLEWGYCLAPDDMRNCINCGFYETLNADLDGEEITTATGMCALGRFAVNWLGQCKKWR